MSSVFRSAKRKLSALVGKRSLDDEIPAVAASSLKGRAQSPPHKPPNMASRLLTPATPHSDLPDAVGVGVKGASERQQPETPSETWSGTGQFGTLPVSPSISHALADMGYEEPTPIQERVIPLIRLGQDLVGQAQTGTGKTTAFGFAHHRDSR